MTERTLDDEKVAHDDSGALRRRIGRILDFYYPDCIDSERGGYVAQFDERTGAVYDSGPRHLVATCRFAANFSLAARLGIETDEGGPGEWREAAAHGLEFLESAHRDPERGGYHWLLDGTEPVDERRSPYGHAFVLLAYARATEAGVDGVESRLHEVADLVEERFVEEDHGLLRSELDADWEPVEPYRGQNANMHGCEAFLAAYEATGRDRYLDRALGVARGITVDLAAETDGLLWEHFTAEWSHDMGYNEDDPAHQFRPWGYQPGHHLEWAKLLPGLARHRDADWLLSRAEELFEAAVETGWDEEYGGFYYTVDADGEPVVDDKYGWPVAEGIGAAAALAAATGDDRYREWYDRQWEYAADHLVNDAGNWYSKLTRENEYVDTSGGPAVEPGYHPIGACYEGLRAFD
ncbi:AGE family epimerase/isomerase [Halobium salinum]|uniref:AGE family epimerase/isomerase n=1 Tax=Halobium salinum TaxID=1364940 RepID=A0ABD5PEB7_9EURY|nr:AGE family epimerase/isomerase [Halobium salinum]